MYSLDHPDAQYAYVHFFLFNQFEELLSKGVSKYEFIRGSNLWKSSRLILLISFTIKPNGENCNFFYINTTNCGWWKHYNVPLFDICTVHNYIFTILAQKKKLNYKVARFI